MSENHISSLSDPGSHKHILSTDRMAPHPKLPSLTLARCLLIIVLLQFDWVGFRENGRTWHRQHGQYQYSTLNSRWIRSTNSQEHHNRCVHPFLYTPPWAQISPFSLNWCITLKSTCPPARPFLVRSNYGKQGLCWNKQPPPNLPPTR